MYRDRFRIGSMWSCVYLFVSVHRVYVVDCRAGLQSRACRCVARYWFCWIL